MSLSGEILNAALESLPFDPVPEQLKVLAAAAAFAVESADRDVFVLNGYAGTGKTSVVGALIQGLDRYKRKVAVLAPTGRAAKVASALSSHSSSTIHRRIFRPNPSDPSGHSWLIARNDARNTLFIVDEASLINDDEKSVSRSLLFTLIKYVYSSPGCRLMLVGDDAQLPPVGQTVSMAMNPDRLTRLGLNPICFSLEIPLRQSADSGIIFNATRVRMALFNDNLTVPEIQISGFPEVTAITSADLADSLSDSYATAGIEETIVITRSNNRANKYNKAIRSMVMYAEEPLERGDRVVVSKNDYFWGKYNHTPMLIANGESAEVTWVGKTEKVYGRYFTEAELRFSDGAIINARIMLRSLVCEGPSIPRIEMERFYNVVLSSQDGELSERVKAVAEDPFYNALQVKYSYCVTCHKAQGGQWKHVYIDMGGIPEDAIGSDFYRWLYTALTRATQRVFLINPGLPLK